MTHAASSQKLFIKEARTATYSSVSSLGVRLRAFRFRKEIRK